jgi:two-component system, NarL family, sensor histidine kinase DesK
VDPCELRVRDHVDDAAVAEQRKWTHGWRGIVFPTVFLVYLVQVASALPRDSNWLGILVGSVLLAAFAAIYMVAVPATWRYDGRRYVTLVGAMALLLVAELPFAHADAFVMGVFVSSLAVLRFDERGLPAVLAATLVAVFLPAAVPSWHDSLTTGFSNGTAISIPLTGLAMFVFGRIVRGNQALADARDELARLAAENERSRIARDLHDLLGHSLTTISVKAELAQRLASHDVEGAIREIGEVASLSRRALGDVRAAVGNYRDVTLAGELATGRELLRAAGIAAELPPAADVLDDRVQELFGWVVREGLTNVVRHSRATTCRVRLSPRSVEIEDDGVGGVVGRGHGLAGLAERVASAGGVIEAGPALRGGWRLAVHVAAAPAGR